MDRAVSGATKPDLITPWALNVSRSVTHKTPGHPLSLTFPDHDHISTAVGQLWALWRDSARLLVERGTAETTEAAETTETMT